MTSSIQNPLIFILFLLLMAAALYGAVTPETTVVSRVGPMQIAPHDNGLSLYQGYRGQFFVFSPFNDYIKDANGNKTTFITREEIDSKSYKTNLDRSKLKKILETTQNYLGLRSPGVEFAGAHATATYTTSIKDNTVTVSRTVEFPDKSSSNPRRLGTTLTYHGGDFVFTPQGALYGFWTDDDLSDFENQTGIRFTKIEDAAFRAPVPGGVIVIVNRFVAGAIVVRASSNQDLYVNLNPKFIEVEEVVEPQNGGYTNQIQVETYNTVQEALKTRR